MVVCRSHETETQDIEIICSLSNKHKKYTIAFSWNSLELDMI